MKNYCFVSEGNHFKDRAYSMRVTTTSDPLISQFCVYRKISDLFKCLKTRLIFIAKLGKLTNLEGRFVI